MKPPADVIPNQLVCQEHAKHVAPLLKLVLNKAEDADVWNNQRECED